VDSYAYFITPPHLGLGGTLLRRVTYVTAPIATASSTQPSTNAVRHPHPIVSQKMETRKAGIAMSSSARFISSRFYCPVFDPTFRPPLLGPIRRRRHVRFPHRNTRNSCAVRDLVKLFRSLIVNVPRDIFSRRIHHIKRRKLVQIFMIQ
jgi:hypothetical protein